MDVRRDLAVAMVLIGDEFAAAIGTQVLGAKAREE